MNKLGNPDKAIWKPKLIPAIGKVETVYHGVDLNKHKQAFLEGRKIK